MNYHAISIHVIGDGGVGKSASVVQYIQNIFVTDYDPTVEDSFRKLIQIPDIRGNITSNSPQFMLDILDTSGTEQFTAMRSTFPRAPDGYMLMYSVTSPASLASLSELYVRRLTRRDSDDYPPTIVVANKADKAEDRKVATQEGLEWAVKHKMAYVETSAKTATNISVAFTDLCKLIIRQKNQENSSRGKPIHKVSTYVPPYRLFNGDTVDSVPVVETPNSTYMRDMCQLMEEKGFAQVYYKIFDSEPIDPQKFRALLTTNAERACFDVKFIVTDESKSILAHKAVLIQRSPYFQAMFTSGTKETSSFEVKMSDFKYSVLRAAIEYCYSDEIEIVDDMAVDLLVAANKLCLGRLEAQVAAFIVKGLNMDNLLEVYHLAKSIDSKALLEYCEFFIIRTMNLLSKRKNISALLTSDEIMSLKEKRNAPFDLDAIQELEDYWLAKLEGTEVENEVPPVAKSSRCVVL